MKKWFRMSFVMDIGKLEKDKKVKFTKKDILEIIRDIENDNKKRLKKLGLMKYCFLDNNYGGF